MNEAAPEVAGQLGAERHQPFRMPFDYSFQRLDDKKRGDFLVLQHSLGRVAEPQPPNDDVKSMLGKFRQPQPGQSDLRCREQTSSWASISAVDFLCVTAGSRGMRPGSRLRPLWLILSLDDPMNYSGGMQPMFWRGRLAVFGGGTSVEGKKLG